MYPISFKSTTNEYSSNDIKKRVTRLLGGTLIGGIASSPYYKYKKHHSGKKLLLSSVETGAAVGLLIDIVSLIFEMQATIKKENLLKNQKQAASELNNNKTEKVIKENVEEPEKQIEVLKDAFSNGTKDESSVQALHNNHQNPSFKAIFKSFHQHAIRNIMPSTSNNIPFGQQQPQQVQNSSKGKKIALGVSAGAILFPLIPLIDGDSFKETYKNRNVAKYTTGLCAMGGVLGAGILLTDDKIKNSKDPYGNRILRDASLGAVLGAISVGVENWAQTNGKKLAKKWYFIAAAAGALIGTLEAMINKNKT